MKGDDSLSTRVGLKDVSAKPPTQPREKDADPWLEDLFVAHAVELHRYLARRVGSEDAEDLVAETFLAALTSRDSYDPARGTVRVWLFGIASHLLSRHHRRETLRWRQQVRQLRAVEQTTDGPDTRVPDRLDAERSARLLAAAMSVLSAGDRDVLLLSAWAQFDTAEIAQALNLPAGTVRSRMHRVRRRLRSAAANSARSTDVHIPAEDLGDPA